MEDEGGIVFNEGDVLSAEGCHMGTDRQAQEVIGRLTLLSVRQQGQYNENGGEKTSSHLNFYKNAAKLRINS